MNDTIEVRRFEGSYREPPAVEIVLPDGRVIRMPPEVARELARLLVTHAGTPS